MDGVGEGFDDAAQEIGSVHLAYIVAKFDVGELGYAVDGQEHVELALRQAKFADVDVDRADSRLGELTSL